MEKSYFDLEIYELLTLIQNSPDAAMGPILRLGRRVGRQLRLGARKLASTAIDSQQQPRRWTSDPEACMNIVLGDGGPAGTPPTTIPR